MSQIETTLHVLRMPVPIERPPQVTRLDYVSLLVGIVSFGVIFLWCLHRWL